MPIINLNKTLSAHHIPVRCGQTVVAFDDAMHIIGSLMLGKYTGKDSDGRYRILFDNGKTFPYDNAVIALDGDGLPVERVKTDKPLKTNEPLFTKRGSTHGDFDSSAYWKDNVLSGAHDTPSWNNMTPAHRQAFRMIIEKLGRILYGNHDFDDHWCDVAGYAKLAEKSCGGKHET